MVTSFLNYDQKYQADLLSFDFTKVILKELLSGSKTEVSYVMRAARITSASCSNFIQKEDKEGIENYE